MLIYQNYLEFYFHVVVRTWILTVYVRREENEMKNIF